ncbi:MAG TPA: NAD(P)-dependent oxidoreductase [Solirubrobacteraceae bacterium]
MTRIGWIGTGVMGSSMAGHLLKAGHDVGVYNRTKQRASSLIDNGATWYDSPAELAADAEVVFTMLGYPIDVREVVLDEDGILGVMQPGSLLIDMTTSEPALAVEIHDAAAEQRVQSLDAPVSGGDVGARNATLVIMVGGEPVAFERAEPLFGSLGQTIKLLGPPGSGQHTKMVNQIAIASGMIALCEALLYAHRAGLDLEQTIATIGGGAAGSWSLTNYSPRILRGDLEPGFKIDHFVKDLGIALAEARRMKLALPGTALAEQLYVAAQGQGLGEKGTQALSVALSKLSDGDWPSA